MNRYFKFGFYTLFEKVPNDCRIALRRASFFEQDNKINVVISMKWLFNNLLIKLHDYYK